MDKMRRRKIKKNIKQIKKKEVKPVIKRQDKKEDKKVRYYFSERVIWKGGRVFRVGEENKKGTTWYEICKKYCRKETK